MIFSLLTFALWGITDVFYKKGNSEKDDKYSDLKTGIIVGIVMGIYALIYMIVKKVEINLMDILKYLPVSLCYISSMVIGYKGLKYLELSIMSPVENTSGVITSLLLILFFKEKYPIPVYIGIVLVFIGILLIYRREKKENRTIGKKSFLAIFLPIIYCLLDGLGTFLDALYLDKFEIINEDTALIAYEFTFLIFAIFGMIYLSAKKEKMSLLKEKYKGMAAIFETLGQFFYVFAMASDSTIGATIVGSYCILSLILSRIFLKEKLKTEKYIAIGIAIIGLILLVVYDP
ncbi:MAG TPA: hypothetical protein DEP51_02550 [Clostridiales bacterium]|nr:hypothetical protein [Clostridiales bacterium]